MRVGFFGGSFDPPHRGHLAVALAAAQAFQLDRVLLAPTAQQPLKKRGASATFADRLAMVELLCHGHTPLKASSLDAPLQSGAPNFTIDTLNRLQHQLDATDEILVLVGADAFLDLRRWRQPEHLLAAAEWIVVSRPGLHRDQLHSLALTPEQLHRVHWLDGVAEPASATVIRESLTKEGTSAWLLPSVLDYIRSHHLYGT